MNMHMGDYRRMVRTEHDLVYANPTTPLVYYHQRDDLWRSPRGTVLCIQALALVAITLSFFLAVFGSCRRWSNRWIVQKGFSVTQVLSLSLGTYSIGLMQSSSVKSELYPVWAVSLLTLLGCVDPVTTNIDLDYKSPLLKVIFQLCLYSGYILLMSASTMSSLFGNIAIGVLAGVTFIKGFHRSLALVLPSITRNKLRDLNYKPIESGALEEKGQHLEVHLPVRDGKNNSIMMSDIRLKCEDMAYRNLPINYLPNVHHHSDGNNSPRKTSIIENVCLGYSLSHLLRRRFLGMNTASEMKEIRKILFNRRPKGPKSPGIYEKTLKAIEVELAFLYEVFFTSNEFLHYYEAKTSNFWALASFFGICLVGIAAAMPGTMASRYYHRSNTYMTTGPGTTSVATADVVNTTTADLVITLVILVSLALLQLMQLMRCWTSIWATVDFACEYDKEQGLGKSRWMKLKLFLVSSSRMKYYWFDNKYLWQDKLGQYSAVAAAERRIRKEEGWCDGISIAERLLGNNDQLALRCIKQAVEDLSWSTDTKGGAGVCLHDDIKVCIAKCLGDMKSTNIGMDLLRGRNIKEEMLKNLPYSTDVLTKTDGKPASPAYAFTHRVMVWHIATWYCELAEQTSSGGGGGGGGDEDIDKNRRVAMDLSKYCAYFVVSAPELLRAPSTETKHVLSRVEQQTREGVILARDRQQGLAAIVRVELAKNCEQAMKDNDAFWTGVHCGKELLGIAGSSTWSWSRDMLARLWVRTLLYAAPCGDVEAHLQHLSQGGEFITHLWALLYHIGVVDEWETETETGTSGGDQNQIGKNRRHSRQGQAKAAGDRRTAPGTSNIRGKWWG